MKQRTQRKRKECIKTRKETCRSGRQGGYLKMACVTGKQTILTLFNRVEIAREKRRESQGRGTSCVQGRPKWFSYFEADSVKPPKCPHSWLGNKGSLAQNNVCPPLHCSYTEIVRSSFLRNSACNICNTKTKHDILPVVPSAALMLFAAIDNLLLNLLFISKLICILIFMLLNLYENGW